MSFSHDPPQSPAALPTTCMMLASIIQHSALFYYSYHHGYAFGDAAEQVALKETSRTAGFLAREGADDGWHACYTG